MANYPCKFIEYGPYSKAFVTPILEQLKTKLLTLDIDLGGACNKRCRNCDTPCYNAPLSIDLTALRSYIIGSGVKGIYVCGKGEPSYNENGEALHEICKMAKESGAIVSTFTNIADLPEWMVQFIDEGILNVLFKIDTLDKGKMTWFHQVDHYDQTIRNITRLEKVVHVKNGVTNVGESLVPMSFNIDELPSIIHTALHLGFYTNIGELEQAGASIGGVYEDLSVPNEKLLTLQKLMMILTGHDYKCPVCPGVFGIHIDNFGNIVVDEETRLSCCWFRNTDPRMIKIGNINNVSFEEATQQIIGLRRDKLDDVKKLLLPGVLENQVFGGCGGDVPQLLAEYVKYFD